MTLTRFSVPPLHTVTRSLGAVAMGREAPDLVITGARLLSTYTERIHADREIWVKSGRIAAVKPAGTYMALVKAAKSIGPKTKIYDAHGGILAPGLVDPHIHIESSMMTACAYAEGALLNGTTTIFCDSHEIGNVCDTAGIEWMLRDARQAPLSIFLTVPSTVPATSAHFETAGGDLTPVKIGKLFDKWSEAVALGEKMEYVQVAMGDKRSHAILAEAIKRGRPVCGHIYGREFVAAGAASGISDTHESIDREIADECLENGLWVFLRGGPPTTPWHSLPLAIKTVTELGANPKRVCVCTDDRDADDLLMFGQDWVVREAVKHGMHTATAWSMGSLNPATRYARDSDIGGLAPARRADIVLLNDDLVPQNTWYGGELVVENRKVTPILEKALSKRYRYPRAAYQTVKIAPKLQLTPALPAKPVTANVIRTALPGIILLHDKVSLAPAAAQTWPEVLAKNNLCFVTVIERHGKSGKVAHGLLKDFGLKAGAVGSSVGHDAHNIILAGTNEADLQLALKTIKAMRGGVCVVLANKSALSLRARSRCQKRARRSAATRRTLDYLQRSWHTWNSRREHRIAANWVASTSSPR